MRKKTPELTAPARLIELLVRNLKGRPNIISAKLQQSLLYAATLACERRVWICTSELQLGMIATRSAVVSILDSGCTDIAKYSTSLMREVAGRRKRMEKTLGENFASEEIEGICVTKAGY